MRDDLWANDLSSRARASFLQDGAPGTALARATVLPTNVGDDDADGTSESDAGGDGGGGDGAVARPASSLDPGDPAEAAAKANFVLLVLDAVSVDYLNLNSNTR